MRSDDLRPISGANLKELMAFAAARGMEVEPIGIDLRPSDGTASVIPLNPARPSIVQPQRTVGRCVNAPNEALAAQLIGLSSVSDSKIASLSNVSVDRVREMRAGKSNGDTA